MPVAGWDQAVTLVLQGNAAPALEAVAKVDAAVVALSDKIKATTETLKTLRGLGGGSVAGQARDARGRFISGGASELGGFPATLASIADGFKGIKSAIGKDLAGNLNRVAESLAFLGRATNAAKKAQTDSLAGVKMVPEQPRGPGGRFAGVKMVPEQPRGPGGRFVKRLADAVAGDRVISGFGGMVPGGAQALLRPGYSGGFGNYDPLLGGHQFYGDEPGRGGVRRVVPTPRRPLGFGAFDEAQAAAEAASGDETSNGVTYTFPSGKTLTVGPGAAALYTRQKERQARAEQAYANKVRTRRGTVAQGDALREAQEAVEAAGRGVETSNGVTYTFPSGKTLTVGPAAAALYTRQKERQALAEQAYANKVRTRRGTVAQGDALREEQAAAEAERAWGLRAGTVPLPGSPAAVMAEQAARAQTAAWVAAQQQRAAEQRAAMAPAAPRAPVPGARRPGLRINLSPPQGPMIGPSTEGLSPMMLRMLNQGGVAAAPGFLARSDHIAGTYWGLHGALATGRMGLSLAAAPFHGFSETARLNREADYSGLLLAGASGYGAAGYASSIRRMAFGESSFYTPEERITAARGLGQQNIAPGDLRRSLAMVENYRMATMNQLDPDQAARAIFNTSRSLGTSTGRAADLVTAAEQLSALRQRDVLTMSQGLGSAARRANAQPEDVLALMMTLTQTGYTPGRSNAIARETLDRTVVPNFMNVKKSFQKATGVTDVTKLWGELGFKDNETKRVPFMEFLERIIKLMQSPEFLKPFKTPAEQDMQRNLFLTRTFGKSGLRGLEPLLNDPKVTELFLEYREGLKASQGIVERQAELLKQTDASRIERGKADFHRAYLNASGPGALGKLGIGAYGWLGERAVELSDARIGGVSMGGVWLGAGQAVAGVAGLGMAGISTLATVDIARQMAPAGNVAGVFTSIASRGAALATGFGALTVALAGLTAGIWAWSKWTGKDLVSSEKLDAMRSEGIARVAEETPIKDALRNMAQGKPLSKAQELALQTAHTRILPVGGTLAETAIAGATKTRNPDGTWTIGYEDADGRMRSSWKAVKVPVPGGAGRARSELFPTAGDERGQIAAKLVGLLGPGPVLTTLARRALTTDDYQYKIISSSSDVTVADLKAARLGKIQQEALAKMENMTISGASQYIGDAGETSDRGGRDYASRHGRGGGRITVNGPVNFYLQAEDMTSADRAVEVISQAVENTLVNKSKSRTSYQQQ